MFKEGSQEAYKARMEYYSKEIEKELGIAKGLIERRKAGEVIPDFDIRGRLYELALELAPDARRGDLERMREWIRPLPGETCVDIAAGTGFITHAAERWVGERGHVYAIDPSREQLQALLKGGGNVKVILGSPDSHIVTERVPKQSVDFVTSFGGIHHVPDQRKMFENVARLLKNGGRFIAGDVCSGTALAEHFDTFVADKCLTGHTANWLDDSRLRELAEDAGLWLLKNEIVPLTWNFKSEREMALFFKGLHAYDLPEEEIIEDLQKALGFTNEGGAVKLNWPMIFFDIRKIE